MKCQIALKSAGKVPESIILYIHMPSGEQEIIINTNVESKMEHIDKTYNDDLVDANCSDIFIADAILCVDEDIMTFGDALEDIKVGGRAARKGWNGKGMYVFLATDAQLHTEADLSEFNPMRMQKPCDGNRVVVGDVLVLRTAQGTLQPGWLASQADMLADDWYILPDEPSEQKNNN